MVMILLVFAGLNCVILAQGPGLYFKKELMLPPTETVVLWGVQQWMPPVTSGWAST